MQFRITFAFQFLHADVRALLFVGGFGLVCSLTIVAPCAVPMVLSTEHKARLRGLRGGTGMVWGLKLPNTFGDYFPHGDFVGWDARKKRFPNVVDGDTYSYALPEKFRKEIGKAQSPNFLPVAPIADDEWPISFETIKRYTSLGSLIMITDGLLVVDDQLKAIIERLEQGVHQFRPLVITMPKNAVYPRRFHTMVIGRFFDSFRPQESDEGAWRKNYDDNHYWPFTSSKEHVQGLALSRSVFGRAHLWRERILGRPDIYLSDELQAEIKKAGLRIPQHFRLKEVA